jgi:hypothetical protein
MVMMRDSRVMPLKASIHTKNTYLLILFQGHGGRQTKQQT